MESGIMKNFSTYKEFHEHQMKNNNGTSIMHNFLLILPTFYTTFLTINILLVLGPTVSLWKKFCLEFLLIVVSIILNVTILEDKYIEINMALVCVTVCSIVHQLRDKLHLEPFIQIPSRRPEYLNISRSVINLITAVCILAVDFSIFPRKLGKTEEYGFGLMDVGVGLFVYSNGIVSPDIHKHTPLSRQKLQKIIVNSLPLLVLGLSRFFVVKQIDYQVHVSEYGVHWNFFMTLAVTKIFGSILLGLFTDITYTKYISILVIVLHELLLQLGLTEYVFDTKIGRENFLTANREGIISILGYVGLYLASVYIGNMIKFNYDKTRPKYFLKKNFKLAMLSLILWKVLFVSRDMFGVSRRLANMGYVIWVLSIGTTMTTLFSFLEVFYYFMEFSKPTSNNDNGKDAVTPSYLPVILNAINYNGLAFFLFANLLTGLVNILFQTFYVSILNSLVILCIYMFILCGVLSFLYVNKIKLKIW